MCTHHPPCPEASAPDWFAAHGVAAHPEQGWTLLCNGAIVFDDLGALLPTGTVPTSVPPPARVRSAAVIALPIRPAPIGHPVLPAAA